MTTNTPPYLTCAETAARLRAHLKFAFPGVKFHVRSNTYSMGASIRVTWIDGPSSNQVKAIGDEYEGASFDGMTDMKSYMENTRDPRTGELVHWGADYVFEERQYTADFLRRVAQQLESETWLGNNVVYEIREYATMGAYVHTDDYRVQELITRAAQNTSDHRQRQPDSPTGAGRHGNGDFSQVVLPSSARRTQPARGVPVALVEPVAAVVDPIAPGTTGMEPQLSGRVSEQPAPARVVEITDYKGHAILNIPVGDADNRVSFGLEKAKAILANLRSIQRFVETDGLTGDADGTVSNQTVDIPDTMYSDNPVGAVTTITTQVIMVHRHVRVTPQGHVRGRVIHEHRIYWVVYDVAARKWEATEFVGYSAGHDPAFPAASLGREPFDH